MTTHECKIRYNELVEFLLSELTYINTMFELYLYLKKQQVSRLEVLNIAPVFFGFTITALLESSSIRLSRFYDKNKDSLTLPKFLNYVEQHRKILFDAIDQKSLTNQIIEDRRKLLEQSELINKLKQLRDNSLAHNDNSILQIKDNNWKNSGITIGEYHNLIRFGGSVINYYLYYSHHEDEPINLTNGLDVEIILDMLEEYKKHEMDYIE